MRRTHTLLAGLFIILLTTGSALAQITAPFAAGLRGNYDGGGVNLRFFFNENLAIEGQANLSNGTHDGGGPSHTGLLLLEGHVVLPNPNFRIFLGAGAHYGTWQRYTNAAALKENAFGFDLIAGGEYVFTKVPLGISLDVKPAFSLLGGTTVFTANMFGLSLRYYFGAWAKVGSDEGE